MRFKSTATQQGITKRVVLGFAALATTAVVGIAGMASAHSMMPMPSGIPGGQASGYGGGNTNTVNGDVNVEVNGSHNVVHVVINYIFN